MPKPRETLSAKSEAERQAYWKWLKTSSGGTWLEPGPAVDSTDTVPDLTTTPLPRYLPKPESWFVRGVKENSVQIVIGTIILGIFSYGFSWIVSVNREVGILTQRLEEAQRNITRLETDLNKVRDRMDDHLNQDKKSTGGHR